LAQTKKAPRYAGLLLCNGDYFFFFVAFFFAGAFLVAIFNSPPILALFTTTAHLFAGKLLV